MILHIQAPGFYSTTFPQKNTTQSLSAQSEQPKSVKSAGKAEAEVGTQQTSLPVAVTQRAGDLTPATKTTLLLTEAIISAAAEIAALSVVIATAGVLPHSSSLRNLGAEEGKTSPSVAEKGLQGKEVEATMKLNAGSSILNKYKLQRYRGGTNITAAVGNAATGWFTAASAVTTGRTPWLVTSTGTGLRRPYRAGFLLLLFTVFTLALFPTSASATAQTYNGGSQR
ncbi:hypothetical protein SK128_011645, partial [Halocaridina rubra]